MQDNDTDKIDDNQSETKDESKDFNEYREKEPSESEGKIGFSETSNEETIKKIGDSYTFVVSPTTTPRKKEKYSIASSRLSAAFTTDFSKEFSTVETKSYDDIYKSIKEIMEKKDWGETKLIKYSNLIAENLNTILEKEEKKNNYTEVSKISELFSELYHNLYEVLSAKNIKDIANYKLYSSFWELKSNLNKKE